MAENPQFAYTGATPEKGCVGFVNIQETDDGVRFTVRSEGENPVSASYVIPAGEALKLLNAAIYGIATGE
jgi:hypothetical protein